MVADLKEIHWPYHTLEEYIEVDSLVARGRLIAGLLAELR